MKQLLTVLVLAVLCGSFAARADSDLTLKSGDFTIQVDVRAQANLIYHLDCLARVGSCTSDAYEQLWRNELGLGVDDTSKVEEWRAIRQEQQASGGIDRILPVTASVPIVGADDDLTWSKIRYADFGSSNVEELRRKWSALMSATLVDRLTGIVEHFRPRFDAWWRVHESEAVRFLPEVEGAMRKARAAELLSAAARFYHSELGDRRVFVHLFLLPKAKWPSSRAGVVGAHMDVEVDPAESVGDRIPIVVHELLHYLFAMMPAERKARLADAMLQHSRAGAAAWNLFNEVQASAIGNILAGRRVMSPESFEKLLGTPRGFYNDDAINLGARAAEELFAKALERGAMRPSFPGEYVSALEKGLGPMLERPALQLRGMALNVNDRKSRWMRKFRNAIRPGAVWDSSPLGSERFIDRLSRFPGLSAVVVSSPDHVSKLAGAAGVLGVAPDELTAALGSSSGLVFVSPRTPLAYAFVFLARDEDAIDGLIAAFQYCQLKPGVCVRIE